MEVESLGEDGGSRIGKKDTLLRTRQRIQRVEMSGPQGRP